MAARQRNPGPYRRWWGWGLLLLFSIPLVLYVVVAQPKERQTESALQVEFSRIAPLPQATPVRYNYYAESDMPYGATYTTTLAFEQVVEYYDEELARWGWQKAAEKKVYVWGADLGGRSITYCKGKYSAVLQYAGERANWGWIFGLSLSWKWHVCRDRP